MAERSTATLGERRAAKAIEMLREGVRTPG
jgi:hypothetical protein